MSTETDLRDALRWGDALPVDTDRLLSALQPARRRRTRWGVATAAVAAANVGIFTVMATSGGREGLGPAAFAIEHLPGDVVRIDVVSTEASAKQMTRQLREYGLDISIEVVPASRQLVGTWVWVSTSGDVPVDIQDSVAEQAAGYTATIELPSAFPGEITFGVGRPTRAGEEPQVSGIRNALAPGGLLFCERLRDLTPAEAGHRLAELGYLVGWADRQGPRGFTGAPPAGLVTEAYVFDFDAMAAGQIGDESDTRDVQVVVRRPSDRLYEQQRWSGFSPSQRAAGTIDYSRCD